MVANWSITLDKIGLIDTFNTSECNWIFLCLYHTCTHLAWCGTLYSRYSLRYVNREKPNNMFFSLTWQNFRGLAGKEDHTRLKIWTTHVLFASTYTAKQLKIMYYSLSKNIKWIYQIYICVYDTLKHFKTVKHILQQALWIKRALVQSGVTNQSH